MDTEYDQQATVWTAPGHVHRRQQQTNNGYLFIAHGNVGHTVAKIFVSPEFE